MVALSIDPRHFHSPPLSFYSRKPTIVLPDFPKRKSAAGDAENGQLHEDNLDRHVEDVLSKRDQFRRIMSGVWAFMKTRKRRSPSIHRIS